ncbi:MAG TPA: iron ABC transporter permease, partial [Desulfarculaceae bacterium]|nr:iron ABC transporter permease [Desulfarculaceae bacterium]
DHRILIPASSLIGASFLILADTLARTLQAPQEIPVGVITALCRCRIHRKRQHWHQLSRRLL